MKGEQRRRIDVDRFEDGGDGLAYVDQFTLIIHLDHSGARKISEPFVPPKPNEFDNATRIGIWRATFGT